MMRIVESAIRRRRVNRRKELNVEPIQTQITDLPKSVLLHILSFLPTKDAVKTSVLAKCLAFRYSVYLNQFINITLHLGNPHRVGVIPTFEVIKMKGHSLASCSPKTVSISVPTLKLLAITEDLNGSEGCKVSINGTSHFKFFIYCGPLRNNFNISDASSLEYASITIFPSYDPDEIGSTVANRARKLFRGLTNVKELVLAVSTLEVLSEAGGVFAYFPLFSKLIRLSLRGKVARLECKALMRLLGSAPFLKIIEFTKGIDLSLISFEDNIMNPVPDCFSTDLQHIRIEDFVGTTSGSKAVRLLLENAQVLDNMDIIFCEVQSGFLPDVKERILNLPKCSESCQVNNI